MKIREMDQISPTLLKGKITELECELWFLKNGFLVSIPEVPYQYDMLVDTGGDILKIQVKTSHLNEDGTALVFNLCSVTHNKQGYTRRIYDKNAVDYFMTEHEGNFYLVPFEECGNRAKTLRLIPTKSGQIKGISFAKDYLAEKILGMEEVVE